MKKFVLVAGVVLACIAACTAAPSGESELTGLAEESEYPHLRVRRVTCDLLSFKGVVGDSACAANCLSMGKSGGSCNGGVCVCRRDTLKKLWDKRFG